MLYNIRCEYCNIGLFSLSIYSNLQLSQYKGSDPQPEDYEADHGQISQAIKNKASSKSATIRR